MKDKVIIYFYKSFDNVVSFENHMGIYNTLSECDMSLYDNGSIKQINFTEEQINFFIHINRLNIRIIHKSNNDKI